MENNIVKISGIIDEEFAVNHTINDKNYYKGHIKVERYSGVIDKVPVIISSDLAPEGVQLGNATITGEFKSRNQLVNGKSKLILYVKAFSIVYNEDVIYENEVSLIGYVCKQPVYRETPKHRAITELLIAVNQDTLTRKKSSYIPTIVWGNNAKFAGALSTGQKVCLEGRIQSRDYTKNNEMFTAYEYSASKIWLDEMEFEPLEEIDL